MAKLRQGNGKDIKNVNPSLETSVTPRLYLDENVLNGLDEFRYHLMKEDGATRLPRLSYIIKTCCIFPLEDTTIT